MSTSNFPECPDPWCIVVDKFINHLLENNTAIVDLQRSIVKRRPPFYQQHRGFKANGKIKR